MKTSEYVNELAKAMADAQNKMKPALKDGMNPHYKSKYTSIASVWESLREPMTSNGLTVWQDVKTHEKGVSIETRIVHASGQWVEFGPLNMPILKTDAQDFGKGISYAKRYALCAAIGVVSSEDDDDAASLVNKNTEEFKGVKIKNNLSEQQKDVIQSLLSGVDDEEFIEKLCTFFNVKHLTEIDERAFESVVKRLEKEVSK